ncbi:hypothetical protein [Pseudaquidulcibacter saccharophilus]|uniref:hypothetical protein n=1 Tax=Pseudaquidulcibacter saccharophilus TaxID=2831900 RepID=UPI001EFF1016|nr:hypothetical protein [Pseudaquidulcibacter saccharophilus]
MKSALVDNAWLMNNFKRALLMLLCATIMTMPAIINGFPFIFQDSADYLAALPRFYRLPVYGWFAKIGALFDNIWLIAFAQGLIISHLLYYVTKSIFGKVNYGLLALMVLVLTLITSLPYFSAFMMADVFTPILFLTLYLLLFHSDTLPRFTYYYFWVLAIFAAMAHITNIYLGAGLIIFAAFFKWARSGFALSALKPVALPLILLSVSAGSIMAINQYYFKTFSLSPASPVFTLANLVSQGSAKEYILNSCPDADFKICQFAKALPTDVNEFIWSRTGIVMKMRGFSAYRNEAKEIVKNTIATYPKEVAQQALMSFVKSFEKHTPAVEINSSVISDNLPHYIKKVYGEKVRRDFLYSAQASDGLPYDAIKKIDNIVYPLSLLATILAAIIFLPRVRDNKYLFPLFTIVFVMGNNFICAAASGLFDRYQARVSWLMVFAVMLVIGIVWQEWRGKKAYNFLKQN